MQIKNFKNHQLKTYTYIHIYITLINQMNKILQCKVLKITNNLNFINYFGIKKLY